ncbi:MAG: trypsin-like peptidase domain-containing protein [Candidatus Lloydbacteria bacterium]|nr:trypsin-like peptidase domain-containing protein [Candidatus Lloydbacteria bacterium]
MEELNKTQIVLLTLFVSFVTSIATGITTVTLMDQAPPAITQTLNRVVEKTIERVIQPASVITKEVKVVVKEEDLVVKAVEKNTSRLAFVTALKNLQSDDVASAASAKEGIGFTVSSDGYVVVDSDFANTSASSYRVRFADGRSFDADVATTSDSMTLLLLRQDKTADKNKTDGQKIIDSVKQVVGLETNPQFAPVSFGDMATIKLGQSVIALGGKTGGEVSTGIVSRVDKTASAIDAIYTNIKLSSESSGGPLLNTDGEVIGMNIARDNRQFSIPASAITALLNAFTQAPQAKP